MYIKNVLNLMGQEMQEEETKKNFLLACKKYALSYLTKQIGWEVIKHYASYRCSFTHNSKAYTAIVRLGEEPESCFALVENEYSGFGCSEIELFEQFFSAKWDQPNTWPVPVAELGA